MATGGDVHEDLVRVSGTGECRHPDLSHLGADSGGNDYYRCRECDAAFIRTGTVDPAERRTAVDAAGRTTGPNPFADLVAPAEDRSVPPAADLPSRETPSSPTALAPSVAATLWSAALDRLPLVGEGDGHGDRDEEA